VSAGRNGADVYTVGFFLIPDFSMMAFAAALEPLRSAGRIRQSTLYRWRLFSRDGGRVFASNGIGFDVQAGLEDQPGVDMMLVCAGYNPETYEDKRVFAWLRRLARSGIKIGALSTGAYVLGRAGLLDGKRCTVHWEHVASLAERFPAAVTTSGIDVVDGKILTCLGGIAALDMMLSVIAGQHGRALANAVAENFIHPRIREHDDRQRMELQTRLGISHPRLLTAILRMEGAIEEPLDMNELATSVELSPRQLERLFRRYLKTTPHGFYVKLRLERGRRLLTQTSASILDVAMACGFVSASHFTKCYRRVFGRTPTDERRSVLAGG
jgi:AraC family transcriptional regulator, glycine betaine-responsive activator